MFVYINFLKNSPASRGAAAPLEPPSKGRLKPRTSNIVVDICYFPLKSSIFRRFSMEKQLKLVQNLIKITLCLFISIFKKFLRRPGGPAALLEPPGRAPLKAFWVKTFPAPNRNPWNASVSIHYFLNFYHLTWLSAIWNQI